MLSCGLASGPLCLGIYLFLWWFLLVIFGLFLLHWRYELPCQDKLPEFHSTPILGCIRVLWHVFHPLGLGLDKALFGWNSVSSGPFWTHKIKSKAKYISISNILHLLSAPASISHVGAVLACLVVESKSNCKFSFISNFLFGC